MPRYIANEYLVHEGVLIQTGQEVELTEEKAEELGNKVGLSGKDKLAELTVPELKEIARDNGLEGYAELKKDELVEVLAENEVVLLAENE